MAQLLKPFFNRNARKTAARPSFTPPVYRGGGMQRRSNTVLGVSDELQRAMKSLDYSQYVQDFINDQGYGAPTYNEMQLEAAYKTSVYLFATMRRVANLTSELRLIGEQKQGDEWERLPETHPLTRMFDEAGSQFLFTLAMQYMLYGQVLVYKEKTRKGEQVYRQMRGAVGYAQDHVAQFKFTDGEVGGLHIIPKAYWMLEEDGYRNEIISFMLSTRDETLDDRERLYPDEVIYWHDFDPRFINGAVSMASLAINNAVTNAAIARWASHYFMSGAMPLLLVSVKDENPQQMTDTDTDKYKSWIEKAWQGLWGRFSLRAVFTDRPLEVQQAGIEADKVQAPELDAAALANIASTFQISPDLIVPPPGGTQARHVELVKQGYDNAVLPLLRQFLVPLNEGLGLNGTNLRVVVDEDRIRALESDRQERAGTEVQIFGTGTMRVSEFQNRLNLEGIDDLADFVSHNGQLMSVDRILREDKIVSDKILNLAQQAFDSDVILRSEYRAFLGLVTKPPMRDGFKSELVPPDPSGGGFGGQPDGGAPAPQLPETTTQAPANADDARQIPDPKIDTPDEFASNDTVTLDASGQQQEAPDAEKGAEVMPETQESEPGINPRYTGWSHLQHAGGQITEVAHDTLMTTPLVQELPEYVPVDTLTDGVIATQNKCYIVLDVAEDSLVGIYRDAVAEALGTLPMEWNDPARWHITLAVVEDATDEQLVAVRKLLPSWYRRVAAHVTGLVTFDTPEGTCIALAVEPDEDLLALQSSITTALSAQGIGVNDHSQAGAYIPHITLGYLPAGYTLMPTLVTGTIIVEPTRLIFGRPEYVIALEIECNHVDEAEPVTPYHVSEPEQIEEQLWLTAGTRSSLKAALRTWLDTGAMPMNMPERVVNAVRSAGGETPAILAAIDAVDRGYFDAEAQVDDPIGKVMKFKATQKTASEELDAWKAFALKHGAVKALDRFEINRLPLAVETSIKAALKEAGEDKALMKRAFQEGRTALEEATRVADTDEDTLEAWAAQMKELGLDDLLPEDDDDAGE